MDTKKKLTIAGIVIAVVFVVFGALACLGNFREFDAQGYVEATLNQTLKGEVEAAVEMTEDATEEALLLQYEESIASFVKNSILNNKEVDEELEANYIALCKKLFASMKFEVQEAEKISNEEYRVPVNYQTTDVFQKFVVSVNEEAARLKALAETGDEYRGTLEEINAQMQTDFLNNSYTLLEQAYENMEYGEVETVVFDVKKGENDLYSLSEEEIMQFITKILNLDEKQD